jgi:hypothetical protein
MRTEGMGARMATSALSPIYLQFSLYMVAKRENEQMMRILNPLFGRLCACVLIR